jgi:hypothetical protein
MDDVDDVTFERLALPPSDVGGVAAWAHDAPEAIAMAKVEIGKSAEIGIM